MVLTSSDRQSGNMIIYILGAIFLMGLLVMIVKGSFQPGTGIDAESNAIKVSQVRAYAAELERAVAYIIRNGKSETDIRFANSSQTLYGTVGDVPARQVFEAAGGGAEFKSPPTGIQVAVTPWTFTGTNVAEKIGTTCAAATCSDLIAWLPDVTKSFCIQINNSLGITNPLGSPPKEINSIGIEGYFTGTFTYSTYVNVTDGYLDGRPEGCLEGNGGSAAAGLSGKYYYYKVLLAR